MKGRIRWSDFLKFIDEDKSFYREEVKSVRSEPEEKMSPLWDVTGSRAEGATPMAKRKWEVEQICYFHGLRLDLVLGKRRDKHAVRQRRKLVYELRLRGWSYPVIGKCLGKDHSSIMNYMRTMTENEKAEIDSRAGKLNPLDPFLKGRGPKTRAQVEARGPKKEGGAGQGREHGPAAGGPGRRP